MVSPLDDSKLKSIFIFKHSYVYYFCNLHCEASISPEAQKLAWGLGSQLGLTASSFLTMAF